jgi:hypothetical protein
MACLNPFDVLRMRVEDLGPQLYVRASWQDPWLNLVPRAEWPVGAGLNRSAFTIGRSEPATDEETWPPIQTTSGGTFVGSCAVTYNQTYVGHLEVVYKPEEFGLVGPLICQDDLTLHWNSTDFWEKYFMALEKRNAKSIINRLANIYMNYSSKAACINSTSSPFTFVPGIFNQAAAQPPPSIVDLNGVTAGSTAIGQASCNLSQDFLDLTALNLNETGAFDPNSNGWMTLGPEGPIYSLLIGQEASNKILLNNSELRRDYRSAFEAFGDANPVIARMGASRVIKNFRHIITMFPPRWAWLTSGQALSLAPGLPPTVATATGYYRVPTWNMSTAQVNATKGQVSIVNPYWQNPNIATYEGCIVLNPWVYTEEVLRPVNSAPGMKWMAQNYMGEWNFITGNDALIGFPDCPAGTQDPTHKLGRHVAEYRHAAKPIFPDYGRLLIFTRCVADFDCVSCS